MCGANMGQERRSAVWLSGGEDWISSLVGFLSDTKSRHGGLCSGFMFLQGSGYQCALLWCLAMVELTLVVLEGSGGSRLANN